MLYLPQGLPIADTLRREGYAIGHYDIHAPFTAHADHTVLLLNLMPEKEVTELDFARVLASIPARVRLVLAKFRVQTFKTTPMEHMNAYYVDVESLVSEHFTHMIVTGAPLEQMPFEYVRYWPQLTRTMDWARRTIARSLYICWGAQAALYHFYGIQKHGLPEKRFGIFPQRVTAQAAHLLDGLYPSFLMPNSRHTEVTHAEVEAAIGAKARIVAEGEESGVGIVAEPDLKSVFVVGHLEYEPLTLDKEYRRDLAKHLPIHAPEHYYAHDGSVPHSWKADALRFYYNWMSK